MRPWTWGPKVKNRTLFTRRSLSLRCSSIPEATRNNLINRMHCLRMREKSITLSRSIGNLTQNFWEVRFSKQDHQIHFITRKIISDIQRLSLYRKKEIMLLDHTTLMISTFLRPEKLGCLSTRIWSWRLKRNWESLKNCLVPCAKMTLNY